MDGWMGGWVDGRTNVLQWDHRFAVCRQLLSQSTITRARAHLEAAVDRHLVDAVAAVEQHTRWAVDEGDRAPAAPRGDEAGIERVQPRRRRQARDVDGRRAGRAAHDGELYSYFLAAVLISGAHGHVCRCREV